ncbi:MAG: PAS domain-containing sensor histidine kinase [Planctomycetota bacterium]
MNTRKIRILVVDDDPDYCRLLKQALKRSSQSVGFVVETAQNLARALELLKSSNFDLVLLDLGLPDSCRLETFDSVHRSHPQIPIVVLTGLEDEQVSIEAIKRGASDYLVKGIDSFTDILVRAILYAFERKRTEEALQLSERNLRNIINKSVDAIVVVDKKGTILFANPAAGALFTQDAEELLGQAIGLPIISGETIETEVSRKGSKPALVDVRTVETHWQDKTAYLVTLRDTTQRRTTEQKLKKYRENLKALVKERTEKADTEKELLSVTFSSMGDGVIVVDPEKRIILFNSVAEELAGWEFERVQDRKIDELFYVVSEHTREPVESLVDKVLNSGKTEVGSDFDVLVATDGIERPISIIAAPVSRGDKTIIGIVLVFRDVSREREIDHMKQDFISSISHELRTPLTSIKAYTETILNDCDMTEQTRRQFLSIIDEESNRLADLIEDLLEVSRLEAGTAKISRERVDIADVTKQELIALQPLAEKKNIRLKTNIAEGLPHLLGDESKIQSLITNLVNNALKFTPDGGEVSVSVQQQAEQAVIGISDTGAGIPQDEIPMIFDSFYRIYRPGEHIQGTGLGLTIVKKIVMLHGGKIEVESEVGKGTVFTIFLPFVPNKIKECSSTK